MREEITRCLNSVLVMYQSPQKVQDLSVVQLRLNFAIFITQFVRFVEKYLEIVASNVVLTAFNEKFAFCFAPVRGKRDCLGIIFQRELQ